MKNILMVAFHYPPFSGGSGVHRTLKFSRYLPSYGWRPIVLTAGSAAYGPGGASASPIPENVLVNRAFALDTARHLSFRGAYPRWMALPDRWVTWWPGAVARGLELIRKHRPAVIWSTYPIATAHLIALSLHRWSGIPWVADFRDPMTETDPLTGKEFPEDHALRRARSWVEARTIGHCSRAVFTTPGTLSMYAARFAGTAGSRFTLVPNGYDEEDFAAAEKEARAGERGNRPIVLVHSGVLYPSERDPSCFFEAVADLRRAGRISASSVKIVLRATGHDSQYCSRIDALGIQDIVKIEPPLPHRKALVEMLEADGLLIFQAANCNRQIPAKLYECLRAQRPIFAMTDPAGDTAALLKSEGIEAIVRLDSSREIAEGIARFVSVVQTGRHTIHSDVQAYSRMSRTRELAQLLDSVCRSGPAAKWAPSGLVESGPVR